LNKWEGASCASPAQQTAQPATTVLLNAGSAQPTQPFSPIAPTRTHARADCGHDKPTAVPYRYRKLTVGIGPSPTCAAMCAHPAGVLIHRRRRRKISPFPFAIAICLALRRCSSPLVRARLKLPLGVAQPLGTISFFTASRRPSTPATEAATGDKPSPAQPVPTGTTLSTVPTWCASPTPQSATIDRGRLPLCRFSPASCITEHFPTDSLLYPPSDATFASPSSSVVLTVYLNGVPYPPLVCRHKLPSAESPRHGACISVSFPLSAAPNRVHHFTGFPPSARCPASPPHHSLEWPPAPPPVQWGSPPLF
jgi:hypothetical protein